jgi:hypothetical protein
MHIVNVPRSVNVTYAVLPLKGKGVSPHVPFFENETVGDALLPKAARSRSSMTACSPTYATVVDAVLFRKTTVGGGDGGGGGESGGGGPLCTVNVCCVCISPTHNVYSPGVVNVRLLFPLLCVKRCSPHAPCFEKDRS